MQTAAVGARRATLLRLLELLLQLASFPHALLARATAGGRARKRARSVGTTDRQPSLPATRSPSPVHSPCHGVTRSASHSGLLAKTVHLNVEQARQFCSNRVITSRYTPLTFVPASLLSLLNPFQKIANFYFLCVGCMQTLPAITITEGRAGTFMPLAFVLFVDMLMRGVEDFARHRADAQTNSQSVDVLHGTAGRPIDPHRPSAPWHTEGGGQGDRRDSGVGGGGGGSGTGGEDRGGGQGCGSGGSVGASLSEPSYHPAYTPGYPRWQPLPWEAVRVGDIVRVLNHGAIPADLLLLGTAPEIGSAWVNTKPLDGESDTKLRLAVPPVASLLASSSSPQDLARRLGSLSGNLRAEVPNDKVNDFVGLLQLAPSGPLGFAGARVTVGPENMLLRGCVLRSTDAVFGLVVSAGDDCKINYTAGGGRRRGPAERSGHMAQSLNLDIAGVALVLAVACVAGAAGAARWVHGGGNPWYLQLHPPPPAVQPWGAGRVAYTFLCDVGRFFLLSYQFIPVSLYVSISMVSSINAYFVRQDLGLYDSTQDEPCVVRSMALLEELGQVTHVFSDKTGTLTQNHMQLRRCLIGGVAYGTGDTTISAFLSARTRLGDAPSPSGTIGTVPVSAPGVSPPFLAPPRRPPRAAVACPPPPAHAAGAPSSELKSGAPGCCGIKAAVAGSCGGSFGDDTPPAGGAGAPSPAVLPLGQCRPVTLPYISYEEAPGTPSLLELLAPLPPPVSPAPPVGAAPAQSWLPPVFGGRPGAPPRAAAAAAARDFFLHLALNHSVVPEVVNGASHLCASSPDELAFVSAAEMFGLTFWARDAARGLVTILDRGGGGAPVEHQIELLDVFPYESSRKRMSIVVRLPTALLLPGSSCREVIYTKGADAVLLKALRQGQTQEVVRHAEETLQEWSEMALRTLVFCRRELPNFAEWRARYDKATQDPEEMRAYRAGELCAITRLQAELEVDLELQGATAIEDKLQDGVPEALADLRAAGIKVWMLTGDKVGTAKNIAAACSILPSGIEPLEITEDACPALKQLTTAELLRVHTAHCELLSVPADQWQNPAATAAAERLYEEAVTASLEPRFPVVGAVRQALEDRAAEFRAEEAASAGVSGRWWGGGGARGGARGGVGSGAMGGGAGGGSHALVLDEKSIELCMMLMPGLLAEVANGSRSVVACRARKDQKAVLLRLVRSRVEGAVCLAVGDGANDVAMLREADVGVGIIGKEGAQAVNNSDFAIGQFRFLRRLMFVHGRSVYRRLPTLIYYIFYKNIIETLVQYWFTTNAGWSGETPFVQIVINWYNMFYTAVPILAFAINDSDLPPAAAETQPRAYKVGVAARWYSHERFWRWQAEAAYASLVALLLPLLSMSASTGLGRGGSDVGGGTPGHFEIGAVVQNLVILGVTLRLVLELHAASALEAIAYFGSLLFWFANLMVFSEVDAPIGMCYGCWGAWNGVLAALAAPLPLLASLLAMALMLLPRYAAKAYSAVRGSDLKAIRAAAAEEEAARARAARAPPPPTPPSLYFGHSASRRGFAFSIHESSARRALSVDT